MSDKPKQGHKHDHAPVALAYSNYTEARKTSTSHGTKEPVESGVAHGQGSLLFGVRKDEITMDVQVQGNGPQDTSLSVKGAISIDHAEHMIRGLMALVIEAKKNEVDKPGFLGGGKYTPLDLTATEEEEEVDATPVT